MQKFAKSVGEQTAVSWMDKSGMRCRTMQANSGTGKAAVLALAREGEISFLEHRHKGRLVLKVMCADRGKLLEWAKEHGIPEKWLHVSRKGIPHFDLWGAMEGQLTQITSSILRGWRGQNGEAYKNGVRLFST